MLKPPFLPGSFASQCSAPTGENRPARLATRLRSFVHAGRGLGWLLRHEANARIHAAAAAGALVAGLILRISPADWRWIVLAIALVWSAEAFNTAIERLCDRVTPAQDELVRIAKDVAAGAVLVTAMAAALIGAATLFPYF
jgi:diacylglycerol kinase (ATP)